MAVFTVANGGGNINAGGTYVGGVAPSSTDTIAFTATSGQLTVNTTFTIAGIDFANYLNTITFTFPMTCTGPVNFGTGGYTVTGASFLIVNTSTTITSNGTTWGGNFRFAGTSQTFTLVDNMRVSGIVQFNGATGQTINGSTLICTGTLTSISAGVNVLGTTNISMQGNSTIAGSNGNYGLNIDINSTGTVSFTGIIYFISGTLSYTAGTINAGTSTIYHVNSGAFVLSLGSNILNNVILISTSSLGSTLNCSGTLTLSSTTSNTYAINCSGSLTILGTPSGTSLITLTGTGIWSGAGTLRNNLTINTTGTITVSGTVNYNTGTLTYIAGTVITTGSTLSIGASTTLNTNGINWNIVTITTGTVTVNSLLTCTTLNLASAGNVIFSGTAGFTTSNLSSVTAGRTITLKNGVTYTINNSLTLTGASGSLITVVSSTTSHAFFNLILSATQNVQNTNGTWIDSSGGQTIKSSFGTLSNTINWEIGQGSWWLIQ